MSGRERQRNLLRLESDDLPSHTRIGVRQVEGVAARGDVERNGYGKKWTFECGWNVAVTGREKERKKIEEENERSLEREK